jgi:NAD(P)-dependent dehydrogenase (short-subunit alcohol dehydrogenase family)
MNGKLCLVTGGSAGIGREAALALGKLGAHLVLLARDRERGESAADEIRRRTGATVELIVADLASQRQVRQAAAEYLRRHQRLDVLILGAGVVMRERRLTEDGIEQTFAVNHLAHFLLTTLLLETLRKSAPSRVVVVASQVESRGRLDSHDPSGERNWSSLPAYFQSKLANVLFTYELARRLDGTGVVANCVHPGVIATRLLADYLGKPALGLVDKLSYPGPEKGARIIVKLASDPACERVSGRYFHELREAQSSAASHDRQLQQRLWQLSEELTRSTA